MKDIMTRIVIISMLVVVILVICGVCFYLKNNDIENIPDNYIAVFHGGTGERTYSTYVYKIDNDYANYGFRYINTTNTTVLWGSRDWSRMITGKGEVTWTDEVFSVAKKNNAYSYVTLPNDVKKYTIDDFMAMFLMN